MNLMEARRQAEQSFKPDHAPNDRKAMPSYETEAVAAREKIARLKALRIAHDINEPDACCRQNSRAR